MTLGSDSWCSIVLCVLTILCVQCEEEKTIFYTPEDHIETLEGLEQFANTILNSERLSIVKFYANWCGYSKAFRPHYKQLANETKLWHNDVLRIAAYDCSLATNLLICQKNRIHEYPTFKFFPAFSLSRIGITELSEDDRSEKFMRVAIRYIEEQSNKPSAWPILDPYK
jgi:thiol-disulfide isomerase/thioredoxin